MSKWFSYGCLRIKYWLQGDSWEDAGVDARIIVYNFRRLDE